MLNREIPFRPKLEGDFRIRFYNAVSVINEETSPLEIEKISNNEIMWVENVCTYNLGQRKKYRAVWMLFRDLTRASWKACYREGVLYMSLPSLNGADMHDASSPEIKRLLRSWMSESRHERLVSYTEFIQRMERKNINKHSIDELIADGEELASRLEKARDGDIKLTEAVKPYLQLVVENERDEFTGIKTSEIWRYFRLTWSTPAETTPGRTMQYLIRDAAHPMHAVMGIASLENCAVQITCRDDFIGWNQKAFIDRITLLGSDEAKKEFQQLLRYLESGISGIDYSSLCTEATVKNPSEEDIQQLFDYANSAEQRRQELLKEALEVGIEEEEKSELGSISKDTEEALYRRKRAEQLARLLMAKKALVEVFNSDGFDEIWVGFCKSEYGNSVIRTALVAQKTQHIGSSLMELNVCGAIPPYNEILGGKLVALLATSPQVIHDYKERYSNKASMIASRIKGEDVFRPADLVYVGTTSLYYVGSSQYNRLRIPGKLFDSDFDVVWKKLGMTIGFGTMHISKATTLSLTEATSDGYNRINHVFGEGASPKMRLLTMSIRELLESTNEDSKDFSKHAMSRIVYGACLASNTLDYLMGKAEAPKYYTDVQKYQDGTKKIIDYWTSRWLGSRLNYDPIYQRIRDFDKEGFLVGNQVKKDKEWVFKKLKEVSHMPVNDDKKVGLQFIRDFYRGTSAYADHVDEELLSYIHLKTKLDDAVIAAAKAGKDIVLTGNPGDGKTHIIRLLKNQLENLSTPAIVELDASTLSNEEIFQRWNRAQEEKAPFVIAINAAVLYAVYNAYPNFTPIKEAYSQMVHSVVFHDEVQKTDSIVVFDLSKREVLTSEILEQAIFKMTAEDHYTECKKCPLYDACVVQKNRVRLRNPLFQERLSIILQRVSLQGYHATLRELQSFIAYLIFGNRSCKQLNHTAGNNQYDIVNLIYFGKGTLFTAINNAIDPINISHPVWDEKILLNDIDPSSWVDGYEVPAEAIAYDNDDLFRLRKRQFFFFNLYGDELLRILDDDASRFQDFLRQDSGKIIKDLISKLNGFFGAINASNTKLQIWSGHRYNNEPRKVLISAGCIKKSEFSIGRPSLLSSMQTGIDMTSNYIRLEKKEAPNIFLKVDFKMYLLLNEAERGVPVLFMESNLVKKVWRFIEQLQSYKDIDDEDTVKLGLMDVQNKRIIMVDVDREDNKYSAIDSERTREV
ncbi:MAG: hypothetical protein BWY15_01666 [Firmicutes bacterium ADurb.Bin193]|nr:MAG: hypothetical protein BWY15_01666 [Firmicutes bacterium ADurb.Bin193]